MARIRVEWDDLQIRASLDRLIAAGTDMTPLMRDIGEHLLNTTRERFVDQKAPDGTPWAPLAPATKQRKKKNKDKILTESGVLRGQLTYRAGRDGVVVGSPTVYAAAHQFGAQVQMAPRTQVLAFAKNSTRFTSRRAASRHRSGAVRVAFANIRAHTINIQARPFLGVSPDDETEIIALVNDYLAEQLG